MISLYGGRHMKILKYKLGKGQIIITRCEHTSDIMVGSMACRVCKYFFTNDPIKKEVICTHE